MSRDLGRDVLDLEKLYAGKLWADFSYPIEIRGWHGERKREGGEPHEGQPSQRWVLDPLFVWYVFHPAQVSFLQQ